MLTKIVTV